MRTTALLLALAPVLPAQSTWYIDLNGTPHADGSPESQYTAIQYAMDQPSTRAWDTPTDAPGTSNAHLLRS